MDKVQVKVKKLRAGAQIPAYMTEKAAAMDACASVDEPVIIAPGERKLVPLGIAVSLPDGYFFDLRPRSGNALKHGVTLCNSPGTIDGDYRGEVGAIVINHGEKSFTVNPGDRICQIVLQRYHHCEMVETDELDETERGSGGFGHTGS